MDIKQPLVFKNVISGRLSIKSGTGVLSLLKYTNDKQEYALIVLETASDENMQLQIVKLVPKEKSQYAVIEFKSISLAELESLLGKNKVQYFACNIGQGKIELIKAEIAQQQSLQVTFQTQQGNTEYRCRSWEDAEKARSALAWCLEIAAKINIQPNTWQSLTLDKTNTKNIVVVPVPAVVSTAAKSPAFFQAASNSFAATPEFFCAKGQELIKQEAYEDAIKQFDQALVLNPQHEAACTGKLTALQGLAIAAYNANDYVDAVTYFERALQFDPNSQLTKDGIKILENRLNKKPAQKLPANQLLFPIENLIFQGGGIKGIAYKGALEQLLIAECGFSLHHIKRVGGTSAGAIMALGLGLGYSLEEIDGILVSTDFTQFFDGPYAEAFLKLNRRKEEIVTKLKEATAENVVSVASKLGTMYASDEDVGIIKQGIDLLKEEQFGLFSGELIRQWVEELIQLKTGGVRQVDGTINGGLLDATFAELYHLQSSDPVKYPNFKDMYFVSVNLTLGEVEVFSHKDTPDAIISDALCCSIAIPMVFKARHSYIKNAATNFKPQPHPKKHLYVDGGLLSNLPDWLFDNAGYIPNPMHQSYQVNPHTLAFMLSGEGKKGFHAGLVAKPEQPTPHSLITYVKQLVGCLFENRERQIPGQKFHERLIIIDNKGIETTQFDLSKFHQELLKYSGKVAVNEYFERLQTDQAARMSMQHIIPAYFTYLDLKRIDAQGNTVLHTAVIQADYTLLYYICTQRLAEINIETVNHANHTAWDLAQQLQHPLQAKIITLFEQHEFVPAKLAALN